MPDTRFAGVAYRLLYKAWQLLPLPIHHWIYSSRLLNRTKAGIRDFAAQFAGRDDIYSSDYYELVDQIALRSVGVISESIIGEFSPRSVADVGCGTGALLAALASKGVAGFGLEYSEAALALCRERNLNVLKFDLSCETPSCGGPYDVVISTEVAEHIPEQFADRLIESITRLSDNVVFTAAIPGQGGGADHVNEQPHEYWISKFESKGFSYRIALSEEWRARWKAAGAEPCYWRNVMVFRKASHSSGAGKAN